MSNRPATRPRPERLVGAIEAINAKQAEFSANHRQNKILLMLLTLFIVGQIVVMEYRLLIRPIVRMAALLQSGKQTPRTLARYARRRDEIGAFAQALAAHFMLVRKEQAAATAEQAKLSGRLESQEQFRRESLSFQDRIGGNRPQPGRACHPHVDRVGESLDHFRRKPTCAPALRRSRRSACRSTSTWWRIRSRTSR